MTPLFVYGTLLSEQPAFGLLAPAIEKFAPARASGLRLHSLGRFPMAVPGNGEIVGEVHWLRAMVATQALYNMDEYEGYEYARLLHPVTLLPTAGSARTEPAALMAWVYLGDPAYAARYPLITSGDWRQWIAQKG